METAMFGKGEEDPRLPGPLQPGFANDAMGHSPKARGRVKPGGAGLAGVQRWLRREKKIRDCLGEWQPGFAGLSAF